VTQLISNHYVFFLACTGLLDLNILFHFKYFIYLYDLTQFSSADVLYYHIIAENCLHPPLSPVLFLSCLLLHDFKDILAIST